MARSLLSNRPQYTRAQMKITKVERSEDTTTVDMKIDESSETFTFNNKGFRSLVRWSNDRGEYFDLRKELFFDYWNRNRPGDERMLQ